ncbi:hypothetical protein [Gluconacetobacter takamatsuzukensis]|uniref:Acylphosphatase n=1 Tax=Gluconacetobacter takamatsuzukensis TaxID=1286190 RepID=A0A7W4PPA7_9PROT|nr:hypothetical protein [Gluconacetobacter takamatsuzukensis]MBB2205013.1 hypothetical protein [Gluconacetobacter takamatsuzukensis]
MSRRERMRLELDGCTAVDAILCFAHERAALMGLECVVVEAGAARVVFEVAGPEPMVGAFEMACSLGPAGCPVPVMRCLPLSDHGGVSGWKEGGAGWV